MSAHRLVISVAMVWAVGCSSEAAAPSANARMQHIVWGMCDCDTPDCITKTRHTAMKLEPSDTLDLELRKLRACAKVARGRAAPGVIKQTEAIATKLCACKDKTCAEPIHAQLVALRVDDYDDTTPKLTDVQKKQLRSNTEKAADCSGKLGLGGGSLVTLMKRYTNQMCACRDRLCAKGVAAAFKAKRNTDERFKKKPPKHLLERLTELHKKYFDCYLKRL